MLRFASISLLAVFLSLSLIGSAKSAYSVDDPTNMPDFTLQADQLPYSGITLVINDLESLPRRMPTVLSRGPTLSHARGRRRPARASVNRFRRCRANTSEIGEMIVPSMPQCVRFAPPTMARRMDCWALKDSLGNPPRPAKLLEKTVMRNSRCRRMTKPLMADS